MPDRPAPRRRWLRRLLVAAGLALALGALAAWTLAQNLEIVARFALERVFPGVRVELGSLRATSLTRLEVRTLTLRSRRTGEPLLTLAEGSASLRLGDAWRGRLDEVRLRDAQLVVSPELGAALGPAASGGGDTGGGLIPWAIGRLVLERGRLQIGRFGKDAPTLDLDVSADLRDFGVAGEAAAREHSVALANIRATDSAGRRILGTTDAHLRFTTAGLFSSRHLLAASVGAGALQLTPAVLALIQPAAPAPSSAPAGAGGWSIGQLDLDGLDVTIPDAPGPLGRISLRVKADLENLGATTGATAQSLRFERLAVATDARPDTPLLTAAAATAKFTLPGIQQGRLESLDLENPILDVALPRSQPGTPAPPAAGASPALPTLDGSIGRFTTRFGTLRVSGLGDGSLAVETRFAFDLQDLAATGPLASRLHTLGFWNVRTTTGGPNPFLDLDAGNLQFRPTDVLSHRKIESLDVKGGRLLVGETLRRLLAAPAAAPSPAPPTATPDGGWTLGAVNIANVRTRLEDKRPGLTELRFTLGTTLRNVRTGALAAELLDEDQTVELSNITLRSPLNPAARILALRSVFVRFNLRDLARKHLREISVLQPSIYLSRDLFVYMERAAAGDPAVAPAATPGEKGWSVDRLAVKFGRLVIGSGGRSDVGLPLEFETTAENLSLDNLATLQLQGALRVPRQDYRFPDYQLEVDAVQGDLRFAYPPEKGEKNLVQKLSIEGVRWRQYQAGNAWVAVTFDARGINGEFGGEAYRGYVNGGFSFFFQTDSPWIGWVAGTRVDTGALTAVISPQNFSMTGPADFELQLDAFRKKIERLRGTFHLAEPGRMHIGKLDDLLANIPGTWNLLKQSSTRIALEALRDFSYDKAAGDFWFVESQGLLNLDLSGPQGSRTFEVAVHDGDGAPQPWQQGKLGKK